MRLTALFTVATPTMDGTAGWAFPMCRFGA